jgi:hypothetical protein
MMIESGSKLVAYDMLSSKITASYDVDSPLTRLVSSSSSPSSSSYSSSSSSLIGGDASGCVSLFDIRVGGYRCITRVLSHGGGINDVDTHRNLIVTCGMLSSSTLRGGKGATHFDVVRGRIDGDVKLYDVRTLRPFASLPWRLLGQSFDSCSHAVACIHSLLSSVHSFV